MRWGEGRRAVPDPQVPLGLGGRSSSWSSWEELRAFPLEEVIAGLRQR